MKLNMAKIERLMRIEITNNCLEITNTCRILYYFPNIRKSEQTVADAYRVNLRNNLIAKIRLNRNKRKVEKNIHNNFSVSNNEAEESDSHPCKNISMNK